MTNNNLGGRLMLRLFTIIALAGILIVGFFLIKNRFGAGRVEVTESGMVHKITRMGKLELVKYSMKDIIEQKETHFILPDSRVIFLAAGDVTACIDLTKVTQADIKQGKDTVVVSLPQPEICYARLDHQRSRVYDITGAWTPAKTKEMVESVYQLAEKKLLANATEMNVLGTARQNAQLIFKPLLENIAGKAVILRFKK